MPVVDFLSLSARKLELVVVFQAFTCYKHNGMIVNNTRQSFLVDDINIQADEIETLPALLLA